MNRREIGGYFGTESCRSMTDLSALIEGQRSHSSVYFNKQNAALSTVIKAVNINRIWIPAYICPSVFTHLEDICKKRYYHVDDQLMPVMTDFDQEVTAGDAVLLVNYFGVQDKEINDLVKKLEDKDITVIVDCAHALFYSGSGKFILKSPRKFAGITNGGILISSMPLANKWLDLSQSHDFNSYYQELRDKGNTESGYIQFKEHELFLEEADAMLMSFQTIREIKGIDWLAIREVRKKNFNHYYDCLYEMNELILAEDVAALYYPFRHKYGSELRQALIQARIFTPILWSDIDERVLNEREISNMKNTVLLPIDQRYDGTDVNNVVFRTLEIVGSRA